MNFTQHTNAQPKNCINLNASQSQPELSQITQVDPFKEWYSTLTEPLSPLSAFETWADIANLDIEDGEENSVSGATSGEDYDSKYEPLYGDSSEQEEDVLEDAYEEETGAVNGRNRADERNVADETNDEIPERIVEETVCSDNDTDDDVFRDSRRRFNHGMHMLFK